MVVEHCWGGWGAWGNERSLVMIRFDAMPPVYFVYSVD